MTVVTRLSGFLFLLVAICGVSSFAGPNRTTETSQTTSADAQFLPLQRLTPDGAAATCTPKWQGPNAGWLKSWHVGNESYAAYQDASEVGCASPYPFKVQNMYWRLTNQTSASLVVRVQPRILSAGGTISCPKPLDTLYQGPVYEVTLPAYTTGVAQLPTPASPCLTGPYFIVAYCLDSLGSGKLGINLDSAQVVPLRTCAAYTNYRGPWEDVVSIFHFPGNLTLWTDGTTAESNGCTGGGACCVNTTGNVDCGADDNVDIGDLTVLIDHMFISFTPLCCMAEANTDDNAGIDISDLTRLIDHLFISFSPLATCP